MTDEGVFLHAKHALMPNTLGDCGPDENSRILEALHDLKAGDDLLSTLKGFEAAYPFVRMIADSTGREPFDYEVTEAYWLGNELLEHIEPSRFFKFAQEGPATRMTLEDSKDLFRTLGTSAKPHHTFYVLGMYSRAKGEPEVDKRLLQLMDSCRISWGRVVGVKKKTLSVERPSLSLDQGRLRLSRPAKVAVDYDREIKPFATIKEGDWVSIHWNFASEKLKKYQLRNLRTYTSLDVKAANSYFARSLEKRRRR
jgi:hypothetical protein